jgi:hypothetical protein
VETASAQRHNNTTAHTKLDSMMIQVGRISLQLKDQSRRWRPAHTENKQHSRPRISHV